MPQNNQDKTEAQCLYEYICELCSKSGTDIWENKHSHDYFISWLNSLTNDSVIFIEQAINENASVEKKIAYLQTWFGSSLRVPVYCDINKVEKKPEYRNAELTDEEKEYFAKKTKDDITYIHANRKKCNAAYKKWTEEEKKIEKQKMRAAETDRVETEQSESDRKRELLEESEKNEKEYLELENEKQQFNNITVEQREKYGNNYGQTGRLKSDNAKDAKFFSKIKPFITSIRNILKGYLPNSTRQKNKIELAEQTNKLFSRSKKLRFFAKKISCKVKRICTPMSRRP